MQFEQLGMSLVHHERPLGLIRGEIDPHDAIVLQECVIGSHRRDSAARKPNYEDPALGRNAAARSVEDIAIDRVEYHVCPVQPCRR
jgi:hypothetical protein